MSLNKFNKKHITKDGSRAFWALNWWEVNFNFTFKLYTCWPIYVFNVFVERCRETWSVISEFSKYKILCLEFLFFNFFSVDLNMETKTTRKNNERFKYYKKQIKIKLIRKNSTPSSYPQLKYSIASVQNRYGTILVLKNCISTLLLYERYVLQF